MFKQAKAHEVYFYKADYLSMVEKYEQGRLGKFQPEELLLVAKGYFIEERYELCLGVIKIINPLHSSKVLFERQSLHFRAKYLLERNKMPDLDHLTALNQIIDLFQQSYLKVPGPKFENHHQRKMEKYKQCILLIEKQISMKVVLDEEIFKEQKILESKTLRYEGFPIYLMSPQWVNDFNRAINKGPAYLCPLTNFAIINDIFEAYHHEANIDQYKNAFVFPGIQKMWISKRYWNYLNSIVNNGSEFAPVKRLIDTSYSQYEEKRIIKSHILIRMAIRCGEQTLALQLAHNNLLDGEFFPILQKKYGTGQLRTKEDKNFPLLDVEGPTQSCFNGFDKIIYYNKVAVPKNIKPELFQSLLIFELDPLPRENLRNGANGLKGLQNVGNSCYLNSCIQCLSFTQQLVEFLTTKEILAIINFQTKDGMVIAAIADLLKSLWNNNIQKSIAPKKFKKIFGQRNSQFSERTQEDAHQFLLCLLNNMHQELKSLNFKLAKRESILETTTNQDTVRNYFERHQLEKNKSILMSLMRGKIHNTMNCGSCNTQSHSYDVFLALTLPIPQQASISIDIYFSGFESRFTKRYRIHLQKLKTAEQLFAFLRSTVLKKSKGQFYYVFGEINKENLTFTEVGMIVDEKNQFVEELSLDQLIRRAEKADFILYEMKRKKDGESLLLLEYRMEKDGLIMGFPRLMHSQEKKLVDRLYYIDLKKDITDNDRENYFRSFDIENLSIAKLKENANAKSNIFDFIVQVLFRQKEKLFKGSEDVEEEFEDPNTRSSLFSCFDLMRQPEVLVDSWRCGKCGKSEQVEKREEIVETSEVLIIHLKRFKADLRKIMTMVDYPTKDLDISAWVEKKEGANRYDLYAVCVHTGNVEYGHYKAYCKHFFTGEWYEFDDGLVHKLAESDVVTPNAYMLFYRRKTAKNI